MIAVIIAKRVGEPRHLACSPWQLERASMRGLSRPKHICLSRTSMFSHAAREQRALTTHHKGFDVCMPLPVGTTALVPLTAHY